MKVVVAYLGESWAKSSSAENTALSAVAEMERSLIADRAKEGMNLSASRGAEIGRPEVTEPPTFVRKWPAGRAQVLAGTMSQRKAARDLRIGVATLKRMLDAEASLPTDRPNSGHALEP
jgi:DNA invertase Pin-like site-specific DNA recombinase